MLRIIFSFVSGIMLLCLASCEAPLPPQIKLRPFPGADPYARIESVACNVLIDNAQSDYVDMAKGKFKSVNLRLYGIPLEADWEQIQKHYRDQLGDGWKLDVSPQNKAYRAVIWRSDGWTPRYLSIALLTARGCLMELPFEILFVSTPKGGLSLD